MSPAVDGGDPARWSPSDDAPAVESQAPAGPTPARGTRPSTAPEPANDPRNLAGGALADALRDSRARTWQSVDDLSDAQWRMAEQPGVNPIAWELAHLAWFAEFWVLRSPHRRGADGHAVAARPARHAAPDAHFDSARLAHAARWTTPMPSRVQLAEMLAGQLEDCIAAIPSFGDGGEQRDAALYFHHLALFHEDMHAEALAWLRSTLGYAAPAGSTPLGPAGHALGQSMDPSTDCSLTAGRAVAIEAGVQLIGRAAGCRGFAFDNEQPAQPVRLAAFEIDTAVVSAGDYLRFVEAGGYEIADCWPGAAGAWRRSVGRCHPARWRRTPTADAGRGDGAWQVRWFDRWLPLAPAAPLIHVNAHEAEAYCRWVGRRLPRAAEWEAAASRIGWGDVWEWTADPFAPYPRFEPGPYMEYSAPWFGSHRELRGACFATAARLRDRRYRNFFLPERWDVFAGFRTVAR